MKIKDLELHLSNLQLEREQLFTLNNEKSKQIIEIYQSPNAQSTTKSNGATTGGVNFFSANTQQYDQLLNGYNGAAFYNTSANTE